MRIITHLIVVVTIALATCGWVSAEVKPTNVSYYLINDPPRLGITVIDQNGTELASDGEFDVNITLVDGASKTKQWISVYLHKFFKNDFRNIFVNGRMHLIDTLDLVDKNVGIAPKNGDLIKIGGNMQFNYSDKMFDLVNKTTLVWSFD